MHGVSAGDKYIRHERDSANGSEVDCKKFVSLYLPHDLHERLDFPFCSEGDLFRRKIQGPSSIVREKVYSVKAKRCRWW